MKDSGFRIRVNQQLRAQFVEICRARDVPAAQVLREFMRAYIDKHGAADQLLLFDRAQQEEEQGTSHEK